MACNFTAWLVCLTARYQSPPQDPLQFTIAIRVLSGRKCDRVSPHKHHPNFVRMACNFTAWLVCLTARYQSSPLPKTHSNPPQSAFYLAANATGCPHTNTTQNLCAWHVILPRGLRVSPLGTSPPPQDPLQSTAIRVLSGRKCDRVSPHKHHPKFVRMACNFTAWLVCLTARYQSPPQDPLQFTIAIRVLSGRKCDRVSPHKHHPKFVRMACNFTAWLVCLTARYQSSPPQDPLPSTAIRVLSGRKCDRVSPHKHHPKFVRIACNFTAWLVCLTARYQSPPPQDPLQFTTAIRVLSGRKCDRVSPHKHHPKFVRMACNFTAWLVCLTARYQSPPQDKLQFTIAIRVLSGRKCDRVSPHKHHPKFVRMACNFTAWLVCLTARYQSSPPPRPTPIHRNPRSIWPQMRPGVPAQTSPKICAHGM
jgi:hypothetical protein